MHCMLIRVIKPLMVQYFYFQFLIRDIPELAGVVEWPPEEVSRPPPAELFEDAKPVDRLVNESLNERYCIYSFDL